MKLECRIFCQTWTSATKIQDDSAAQAFMCTTKSNDKGKKTKGDVCKDDFFPISTTSPSSPLHIRLIEFLQNSVCDLKENKNAFCFLKKAKLSKVV